MSREALCLCTTAHTQPLVISLRGRVRPS